MDNANWYVGSVYIDEEGKEQECLDIVAKSVGCSHKASEEDCNNCPGRPVWSSYEYGADYCFFNSHRSPEWTLKSHPNQKMETTITINKQKEKSTMSNMEIKPGETPFQAVERDIKEKADQEICGFVESIVALSAITRKSFDAYTQLVKDNEEKIKANKKSIKEIKAKRELDLKSVKLD